MKSFQIQLICSVSVIDIHLLSLFLAFLDDLTLAIKHKTKRAFQLENLDQTECLFVVCKVKKKEKFIYSILKKTCLFACLISDTLIILWNERDLTNATFVLLDMLYKVADCKYCADLYFQLYF